LLGLASGKDPASFDRVWFKEPIEPADITFDFDTYLLTAVKAKTLKQAPSQPAAPQPVLAPVAKPAEYATTPATSTESSSVVPVAPKAASISWEGELKRKQWNLFSLKVLTRLAQADLEIQVKVKAKLKEAQTLDQLNDALKELGIEAPFRKE